MGDELGTISKLPHIPLSVQNPCRLRYRLPEVTLVGGIRD